VRAGPVPGDATATLAAGTVTTPAHAMAPSGPLQLENTAAPPAAGTVTTPAYATSGPPSLENKRTQLQLLLMQLLQVPFHWRIQQRFRYRTQLQLPLMQWLLQLPSH
jgi:hypothetical protein